MKKRKMNKEEKEAWACYQDRLSMIPCSVPITYEEAMRLMKENYEKKQKALGKK